MKKDINKIIEEQNPDEKQAVKKKLQSVLGISEPSVKASSRKLSTARIISVAVACLCVICVAITLPIVLTNQPSNRFCTEDDYAKIMLDCTIKEYAEQTGRPLLYVDWYDLSEDTTTELYASVHDVNDMIFLHEIVANEELGQIVYLFVHDNRTTVEALFDWFYGCTLIFEFKGVNIKYSSTTTETIAFFEYQGYKYYIEILEPNGEDLLKEVVENMLNK